jgi:hypothetical protein
MIKIEITAVDREEMDHALDMLGMMFRVEPPRMPGGGSAPDAIAGAGSAPAAVVEPGPFDHIPEKPGDWQGSAANNGRVPGEPGPGRKRRSADEVKADFEYLKTHPEGFPNRSAAAATIVAETQSISAGGERIDPQDAADEKAGVEKKDDRSADDLRATIRAFTDTFGIDEAGLKNLRATIGGAASDIIKQGPAACVEAEQRLRRAIAHDIANSHRGKPSGADAATAVVDDIFGEPTQKELLTATRDEVHQAVLRYAKAFDGTDDQKSGNEMVIMREDCPKIVSSVLPGITTLRGIPEDPVSLGKVKAAILAAIAKNPFGRTPK